MLSEDDLRLTDDDVLTGGTQNLGCVVAPPHGEHGVDRKFRRTGNDPKAVSSNNKFREAGWRPRHGCRRPSTTGAVAPLHISGRAELHKTEVAGDGNHPWVV